MFFNKSAAATLLCIQNGLPNGLDGKKFFLKSFDLKHP